MCSSVRPVWNHKERQSRQRTQASGPLATLRLPNSEMRSLLHWIQRREVEFFLRSRPRSHRFRTRAGVLSGSAKGTHRAIGRRALGVCGAKASHHRPQNLRVEQLRTCFCITSRETAALSNPLPLSPPPTTSSSLVVQRHTP